VLDEPRPGRPRTITDEQVEEVIVRTLETTPRDATLVDALDGQSGRAHSVGGAAADLEGVRAAAPPPAELQAVQGPAVHRQGPRRRRAVPEPARARSCCASIRSPRSRRWTAPRRSCRCRPAPQRASHHYKRAGTSRRHAALDITTGRVIAALHPDRVSEGSADHRPRGPDPVDVHPVPDSSSTHQGTGTAGRARWPTARGREQPRHCGHRASWTRVAANARPSRAVWRFGVGSRAGSDSRTAALTASVARAWRTPLV
jgi:hypothetical protein